MQFPRYALALLASFTGLAGAATRTWPGAAPCDASLQACINAAADGDRIEIATQTPITEPVVIRKRSLTLTAADGYAPQFTGDGLFISNAEIGDDLDVRISRLNFANAYISATYSGTGTANLDLRELTLTYAPGSTGRLIRIYSAGGTVNASLYDNRLRGQPPDLNSGLMELVASASTLNVEAYYNRIESSAPGLAEGAGLFVDVHALTSVSGAGSIKLHGNRVQGAFSRGAFFVSEGLFTSTASAFDLRMYSNVAVCGSAGDGGGSGIDLVVANGTIDAQAINNTVSRCNRGLSVSNWDGAAAGRVTGTVYNNLVSAQRGIHFNAAQTPDLSNDYNLIDAPIPSSGGFTLGPHTILARANLVAAQTPRLRADSPARDAADTGMLGFGLIFNGLPLTDADGLRRIKNPAGSGPDKADIGAYEFGDISFAHSTAAANIDDYISTIDHPAGNDRPGADLFLTPNFDGGENSAVTFNRPFGVWYSGPRWTVFDQGFAAIPEHVDFDAFVPARGSGVFRHVADASNASGWTSQLDDASVNGLPDRIVLVTQNWSAGPVYNAHPVGVFYFSFGGPGAWLVANLDMTDDLPLGAGFNVYAQQPSPNAFRATATAANTLGSGLVLDHPLLNGTACAQPMVTRLFDGNPVAGHFDVDYDNGKWRIFSYDGMPAGTQFHVLVNPAQIDDCRDRLFADGFD